MTSHQRVRGGYRDIELRTLEAAMIIPFAEDAYVRWVGSKESARYLGLQPDHPGIVAGSGEKHAVVLWVDRVGLYDPPEIINPEALKEISFEEFEALKNRILASDWRGFR